MTSLTSLKRKVHQRAVNKFIRSLNKALEEDELWKGRFYCRQTSTAFEVYFDRSGGILHFRLRFYDKQKKEYFDVPGWFDSGIFFRSHICEIANDYIIYITKVWDEHPTRDTTINYRGVHIKEEEFEPVEAKWEELRNVMRSL